MLFVPILADHRQTLTVVLLLEIIIGANAFNLGFSGMSLTTDQMTGTIQVWLQHEAFSRHTADDAS